jgi:hypothetical protein
MYDDREKGDSEEQKWKWGENKAKQNEAFGSQQYELSYNLPSLFSAHTQTHLFAQLRLYPRGERVDARSHSLVGRRPDRWTFLKGHKAGQAGIGCIYIHVRCDACPHIL